LSIKGTWQRIILVLWCNENWIRVGVTNIDTIDELPQICVQLNVCVIRVSFEWPNFQRIDQHLMTF
jgi:hypothetical protein